MGARKNQLLLIAGALILSVLLFIAPKTLPKSKEPLAGTGATSTPSSSQTLELFVTMANKNVAPEEKKRLDKLLSTHHFDSVALFWDKARKPDIAAYFIEQKALKTNMAKDWFEAGNRYFNAVQFCQDESEVPVLYQSATRCFSKGLKLDPENTEANIMLASCYVESSSDPMKGISILKEIEKKDSNNVKLQLAFAFFSVKSGQTGKAVERFKKVLRIDSTYIAAWLHLADVYERQGETDKTITMLEEYAARTNDITARLEIKKYIEQIKTNKQ
jgi:lipopolysaccharide biosynthesis regulator YciM